MLQNTPQQPRDQTIFHFENISLKKKSVHLKENPVLLIILICSLYPEFIFLYDTHREMFFVVGFFFFW